VVEEDGDADKTSGRAGTEDQAAEGRHAADGKGNC
jgi:hypothetical protein